MTMGPNARVPLEGAIADFSTYLEGERRLAKNTVVAYQRDLAQLHSFLEARLRRQPNLGDLNKGLFRAWLGDLATRISPPSTARKLACIRTLCSCAPRTRTRCV